MSGPEAGRGKQQPERNLTWREFMGALLPEGSISETPLDVELYRGAKRLWNKVRGIEEKPKETQSHLKSEQQPEIVKVRVNLLRGEVDDLKEMAAREGVSVTETLRAAIATEKYLRDAVLRGEKVLIEKPNGKMDELKFR